MTAAEKRVIRSRLLDRYEQAVDDRKACYGQVAEHVNVLRDIVWLHGNGALAVAEVAGKTLFGGNGTFDLELPSHDDMVTAVLAHQEALREEERCRMDAIQAGVDQHRIDAVAGS